MIFIFAGVDEYLKTEGAKQIIDKLVPLADRDFGLETIEARCEKCDDVLMSLNRAEEALFTESFFGGGKVVWLRDANFLPGVKNKSVEAQAAKDAVAAFCENLQTTPLPEGHHLIITTDSFPQTSRFAKWIAVHGKLEICGAEVRSFNLEKVALERLEPLMKACGVTLPRPVQSAFVQRVGADSRTLMSELEKLKTYVGHTQKEITLADVEAITSAAVGGEPYDLITALQVRSATQLVRAVERLRIDKNAAFPAAAVVLNTLNDWCALADAIERHWLVNGQWTIPSEQVPLRLARLKSFALTKAVEAVKRYSLTELRAARHYAVEMRFKLVDTTEQEPWAIIEPVLLRIVARRPSARRQA